MRMARVVVALIVVTLTAPFAMAQAGDGCRYPFVWREAFPSDHVCVTPGVRSQAAADNAVAASRVNPVNHDYGPDTCRYGFVWREANPSDHVCVVPGVRSQAARDNAAAPGRYASAGGPTVVHSISHGSEAGCCPNSLLVCPLGRHFCR